MLEGGLAGGRDGVLLGWVGYSVGVRTWRSERYLWQ
jgi:hypothetical protein